MAKEDAEALLAAASKRFQDVHADIGRGMRSVFPDAAPVVAHGMAGWQVAVPDPPPESEWRGTLDRIHLQVFPSERKAGITTHVWDPKDPSLLKRHEPMLRDAGFKVMVGCLQWNRQAPFPADAIEGLLRAAKDAW